ncbi:MAG: tRNA epoxyqueuosine(34) reductase QueG [Bacteroidales bacterium]|nr:tRNA epoxyqueuosine(34) reductase QueG [Bacteroidales bacterium]
MSFSEEIKKEALRLGFDACGISPADNSGEEERYMKWIEDNWHADMHYMARNIDKRVDPRLLVEGAKSIISVALNYYPHKKQASHAPQFAYYAYGKDYHDVIRGKLKKLFEFISARQPELTGRYFSDSAPVLERFWAAQAGIGFVGKNSLLIIPGKGSFFFLGELIIDIELEYDSPIAENCGSCTRCLDGCPTSAIEEPYKVNANKCISYQTIENRGEISSYVAPRLKNYVFGCDICQKVCPWNRVSTPHNTIEFMPNDSFMNLDLKKMLEMDEEEYREVFRGSAVKRAKFAGLKRNVIAVSKTRKK